MSGTSIGWALLAEAEQKGLLPFDIFTLLPIVGIVFLYIFIVQRPQRREQMQRQAMLSAVKKNDHVLLNCGIFGVVTNVRSDADEITIRIDETSNARMRVTRGAIARVITDEPAAKTDAVAAE